MHVGLLIYGSLDTVSGGFIYDRNLVRYLREAGDRVDVISLPWRRYGLSLLDNLNAGLRRRLTQAAFDVLLEDELVHPSCFWLNQRLRPRLSYPVVAIVHHLRCRERHPAFMTPAVPLGGKTLPGLGGRLASASAAPPPKTWRIWWGGRGPWWWPLPAATACPAPSAARRS